MCKETTLIQKNEKTKYESSYTSACVYRPIALKGCHDNVGHMGIDPYGLFDH